MTQVAGTLVLLHGITDSGRCWPDAVPRWTAAGWRVLACDARGHGDGPRWDPQRLARGGGDVQVDDVLELLEREHGGQVVLVGHSMGAYVAVAAAARRADRVAAVVAEDPPWSQPASPQLSAERLTNVLESYRQIRALSCAERIARHREQTPGWSLAELRPWAEAKDEFDEQLLVSGRALPSWPWPELVAALREHRIPLLLVTGDRDVEVDDSVAHEAARLGAQVVRIPGAGHCVRRDQPAAYHAVVDRFLDALDGP
jgi:lipase